VPLSSGQFIEEVMQKFQKELKEFMDKTSQLISGRKHAMERKLKLTTWNANGLAKHSLQVKAFIFSQDIDILLVSEMHFTNKSYLRIPGYTLYHTMHPDGKAYGGIAFIRSSIKHYEIDKHQRDFLQATSAMIEIWNGCITISAVYSLPKHVIKSEQYINFLSNRKLK